MEAPCTARLLENLVQRPSTERRSLGNRYEENAKQIAQSRGLKLLCQGFRIGHLEGDLLFIDPDGRLVMWEVRGSLKGRFPPSKVISPQKIRNLRILGSQILRYTRSRLCVELVEFIGAPEAAKCRIFRVF